MTLWIAVAVVLLGIALLVGLVYVAGRAEDEAIAMERRL